MPVLTVTGYENLLAIVYHTAPAFYGQQALRMKIIEIGAKTFSLLSDVECPITR